MESITKFYNSLKTPAIKTLLGITILTLFLSAIYVTAIFPHLPSQLQKSADSISSGDLIIINSTKADIRYDADSYEWVLMKVVDVDVNSISVVLSDTVYTSAKGAAKDIGNEHIEFSDEYLLSHENLKLFIDSEIVYYIAILE